MSLVNTTATSITVIWTPTPDANGYVVYTNSSIYDIIGSGNTSIVLYGLIPRENYFIIVRAYRDILGPATALDIATADGNHKYASECNQRLYIEMSWKQNGLPCTVM